MAERGPPVLISIFHQELNERDMDEVKRIGPEGNLAHREARKILILEFPKRRPRQKKGKAKRHESEAKSAGKIVIWTEDELPVPPAPERSVERNEYEDTNCRCEQGLRSPKRRPADGEPSGEKRRS